MRTSIKEELTNYIKDLKNDNVLTNDNKEDWHYLAFNVKSDIRILSNKCSRI